MKSVQFHLFGTETHVHPSFVGLLLYYAYLCAHFNQPLWVGVIGMICLFMSILIHELGHALMFRLFGSGPCIKITIHAIGGYVVVCAPCMWRLSATKKIAVAFAGPFAGFCIAIVAFLLVICSKTDVLLLTATNLVIMNVALSLSNLLPTTPLDGGRMMEALCDGVLGRTLVSIFVVTLISSTTAIGAFYLSWTFLDPVTTGMVGLIVLVNVLRIFLDF